MRLWIISTSGILLCLKEYEIRLLASFCYLHWILNIHSLSTFQIIFFFTKTLSVFCIQTIIKVYLKNSFNTNNQCESLLFKLLIAHASLKRHIWKKKKILGLPFTGKLFSILYYMYFHSRLLFGHQCYVKSDSIFCLSKIQNKNVHNEKLHPFIHW